jgi:hypothetical protein
MSHGASPDGPGEEDRDWPANYFNYFTEIEEYFRRARGTGLFLLSPLDWALIENWKNAGIALEAVLEGIRESFEKWHRRKKRTRQVNSVAYCTQAVMEAAQRAPARSSASAAPALFTEQELRGYLEQTARQLRGRRETTFQEIASSLDTLASETAQHLTDIEGLERRLTALEDKMVAAARTLQTDEDLYSIRESLDRELKPYRSKMTAEQLSMLERRYLDTAILERSNLPRLSLFYLH